MKPAQLKTCYNKAFTQICAQCKDVKPPCGRTETNSLCLTVSTLPSGCIVLFFLLTFTFSLA